MDIEYLPHPKTLYDCFEILKQCKNELELNTFKDFLEENAVATTYYALGARLRNLWNLNWSVEGAKYYEDAGYPQEMPEIVKHFREKFGVFHGKDMSGMILRSFHRHLNNKPLKLDEQAKHYQNYWQNQADDHKIAEGL